MRDFNEEARLDALLQLKLLDKPPSESFDRITRMTSQIFGLPVATVSLTDRDRQWFKSRGGVEHDSIPRFKARGAQVAETAEPLVITDFLTHSSYADSLLARNGTRFYAGVPLVTSEGYGLGSLSVLGTKPRGNQIRAEEFGGPGCDGDGADRTAACIRPIDPLIGVPTRTQFRDDLIDLARDHPDEQRFAVVVGLARDDQVSRMRRALRGLRLDEMVRKAAVTLRAAIGPARSVYHVGLTQFAFLSPPGVEQAPYLRMLQVGFDQLRETSSVRFVSSVALGVRPFLLGRVSADDVLRGGASAALDASAADGAITIYS